MNRQLDIGSNNPRMQCAACGRWMRLHGKRLEVVGGKITEVAVQNFYGGCSVSGGDHPFNGDVCSTCCPTKCLEKLGCNCQAPFEAAVHSRREGHDVRVEQGIVYTVNAAKSGEA